MKNLLPIIVVGSLVLSGLGAVALQENEDKTLFSTESIMISGPVSVWRCLTLVFAQKVFSYD